MSAPAIVVSDHAVQRYRERICAHAGTAEIMAVLTGPIVALAAAFGACVVRIPHGRIILEHTPVGVAVVTVLPIFETLPRQLIPAASGGPMPIAHERARFPRISPPFAAPQHGDRS